MHGDSGASEECAGAGDLVRLALLHCDARGEPGGKGRAKGEVTAGNSIDLFLFRRGGGVADLDGVADGEARGIRHSDSGGARGGCHGQ